MIPVAAGRAVALFTLGWLGGCAWLMETPRAEPEPAAAPARARASLYAHPWVWSDEQGRRIELARWRGREVVVTAAFTSCRETCPRTVRRLREVYEKFRRDRRDAQFIIVTLDPATDTPERLLAFKKEQRLPASWHLLTGPRAQTRELARLLGIHTFDLDSHVMHDGAIVIFDAQGRSRSSYSGWNLEDERPL